MDEKLKNNTAILIGNGFDLSFKMNTSYSHFLKSDEFETLLKSNNYLAKYIKTKFDYSTSENDKKWVDIEIELGNYSNLLIEKNDPNWQTKNTNFEKDFWDLSRALKSYLHKNTGGLTNKKLEDLVSSWCKNSTTNVLSFNYTYLVTTEFFNKYSTLVYYIHGRLSSSSESVVLGIDEACKVPLEHSFLYKSFNPDTNIKGILNIISNANKIIIYGCSIGETDEFYFKHVFENVKNKSFEIFYFGEKEKAIIMNRIHQLSGSMHKLKCHNEIKFIDSTEYSLPTTNIKEA